MRLVDVFGCSRCGGDHPELEFTDFEKPVEVAEGVAFSSWALCPINGEPLMMWAVDDAYAERPAPDPAVWYCKVGEFPRDQLPEGADSPLRQAVEIEYERLTGQPPQFTFSGWGAALSPTERAEVEKGSS